MGNSERPEAFKALRDHVRRLMGYWETALAGFLVALLGLFDLLKVEIPVFWSLLMLITIFALTIFAARNRFTMSERAPWSPRIGDVRCNPKTLELYHYIKNADGTGVWVQLTPSHR